MKVQRLLQSLYEGLHIEKPAPELIEDYSSVEELVRDDGTVIYSFFDPRDNTITLRINAIPDEEELIRTVVHEAWHAISTPDLRDPIVYEDYVREYVKIPYENRVEEHEAELFARSILDGLPQES